MEELKNTIKIQSQRIRELEDYFKSEENTLLKRVLPKNIKRIIDLSKRTYYSKEEFKKADAYWVIESSLHNDQIIKQKVLEYRLHQGIEKFNKYIKTYNFNNIESLDDVYKCLDKIYSKENKAFKLHISFGYVTENLTNGEVRLFAPTQQYYFDRPEIVKTSKDIESIKHEIDRENVIYRLTQRLPDTQTRMLGIFAMGVKIIRLDFPIGAKIQLPPYIKISKFINGLEDVDNNMCFWACLALANGCRKDRYITEANKLFTNFYKGTKTIQNYDGFDYVNELDKFELQNDKFAINIMNYNENETISYIRKSEFNVTKTPIYLNLFLNHLSYIPDLKKLAKIYLCDRCDSKFPDRNKVLIHMETCTLEQKDTFNKYPTIWQKKRNIIIELADYFEVEQDFKYEYLITFDLESLQTKTNERRGDKLLFVTKHVAISVSIATNVPGYNDSETFIMSDNPKELTQSMFEQFDKISKGAKELMLLKMSPLIEKLERHYNQDHIEKYYKSILDYCSSIPIVGFNSGFYDTNLLADEGFMQEIIVRDPKPFIIKDGKKYKAIKTEQFIFLDQMSYCAAGTSLRSFIEAYDVGEQKSYFPYEWLDNYAKLDYLIDDLCIDDFDSTLKNAKLSLEDFNKLMTTCKENNLIYIRDLLKWYNNLDVKPMLKACLKQKEFYYTFNLDMYKDAFSLPGLSENIMFQFSVQDFEEYLNTNKTDVTNSQLKLKRRSYMNQERDAGVSNSQLELKIRSYMDQDRAAGRSVLDDFITLDEIRYLLKREQYSCFYCWKPFEFNWSASVFDWSWSLDRINCSKSHIKDNCVIACIKCNTERSDTLHRKFYRKKALVRYEKENPMIWEFSEENKDIFYKFKNNIIGGASIVYHRYHEKDKTEITRVNYDQKDKSWSYPNNGKVVKKISGFDANALYLYCLGEEMPCGKLTWEETNDLNKLSEEMNIFGFFEVDIEVPEDKYQYFSEMCPIFKNIEFSEENCGEYTKRIALQLNKKCRKSKKLIASLKAVKILIKSTRLRWLTNHGCMVTKLYGIIHAKPRKIFTGFMDWVSDERRKGDVDLKYAIIAEGAKIVGNSAFGRTGMDKNKHKKVKFCNEVQFNRAKNNYFFYDAEDYNGVYEVVKRPKTVKQNMPIHIAFSVYDDSKLRMLQFYYDCVDKYLDRSDFQYIEMDTDSAYIALTDDFENLINPELKQEFSNDRINWFPRTDTKEHMAFDRRKPGLFKIEFEGDGMVALCSKSYFVWGSKNKISCKGIQQSRNMNILNKENYLNCLFNGENVKGNNKGFRFINKTMKTYEQDKIGLSPLYTKGVVMDDGIHIRPLDI